MSVTLPYNLLLLDLWPLNRGIRLKEKIPFILLAAASCIITYMAQNSGGAVRDLEEISMTNRLLNALISYCLYIHKFFWPDNLALFYPHMKSGLSFIKAITCFTLLAIITAITILNVRKKPWLFTGWFWFAGSLLPVIGIIQVGTQSMADRYTYIPSIGLILILFAEFDKISWSSVYKKYLFVLLSVILLAALSVKSFFQIKHWKNTETVFLNSIKVNPENAMAYSNLGFFYTNAGNHEKAILYLEKTIKSRPDDYKNLANIGLNYLKLGRYEQAIPYLEKALKNKSNYDQALNSLGLAYLKLNKFDKALPYFLKTLKISPDMIQARKNLAVTYLKLNKPDDAVLQLKKAGNDPEALMILDKIHKKKHPEN